MTGGECGTGGAGEQLHLDLGVTGRAPTPAEAWWVAAIEHETEGNQDTGWWDA
ncbi:hypothetical protein BRM3_09125 [Brachybacterium huguangmaarense]|uniref:Uncharacterized protein n=1 Tax=Brachybacterium huguangmaarense TaxID=1652028 RepID=A0ABY6FY20_9MICO|nr:hypothetical protein [Brachybacterium huguangmaarense]UYG15807.1 hypothetical protein BRM3_09125 [Brachybacterium huguangmaarense]